MSTSHLPGVDEFVSYVRFWMQPGEEMLFEWPCCLTQAQAFEVFQRVSEALEDSCAGVVIRTAGEIMEVVKYATQPLDGRV